MKKHFILLISLVAVALSSITASADPVVKTREFFAGKTYTWTNANGGKITSSLAEPATDPRQIMAMLKYIYTDKSIPGILQCGYTATGEREGVINYKVTATSDLNKSYGIAAGDYTPNEEGYTTLAVKVKDFWVPSHSKGLTEKETLEYISKSIESVEVLTEGVYIPATTADGKTNANPGAVYRLSGNANRFFFMSKGRGREWSGSVIHNYAPFNGMFEEYSPVAVSGGKQIENFYEDLVNGSIFKVEHDCSSVTGYDEYHFFCMMGKTGTKHFDVSDMIVTIPDYRLWSWKSRDLQGSTSTPYTNYEKNHAPSLGLYGIQLKATATPAAGKDYKVTLDWTSSLNQITGNEIPQRFLVWYRDVDGSIKPLMDAEGKQVTVAPGETFEYSYLEPQLQNGREITYIVSGQPTDGMFKDFQEVYSNNDKVFIPGLDLDEGLRLEIGTASTSDYDLANETNNYKNFITIAHNVVNTHVKYNNLQGGSKLTFYRYDVNHNVSEATKIAELSINSVGSHTEGSKKKTTYYIDYNYSVKWYNQEGSKQDVVDATYSYKTNSSYTADEEVDFKNFQIESFNDEFSASTAKNEHPESYEYKASFTGLEGEKKELHSSFSLIKVYKTEVNLTDNAVTLADVENDNVLSERINDGKLDASPAIQFSLEQDRMIAEYDLNKVINQASEKVNEIGMAQRLPSWNYAVYENGSFKKNVKYTEKPQILDASLKDGDNSYVPVINTYRNAIDGTYNTYGAPLSTTYRIRANVTEEDKMMSKYTFQDANGKMGRYYQTVLNIAAEGVNADKVVKYRVWRVVGGNRAMEVNPDYMARLDEDAHPIVINSEEGMPAIDEERNSLKEFSVNGILNPEFLPQHVDDKTIHVTDIFGASDVENDDDLDVTYIVRIYAKPEKTAVKNDTRMKAPVLAKEYYIAEAVITVNFTENTPTGIDDIVQDTKIPAKIEYVNMYGQKSVVPFSGMNVVVTTYTDGTHSTVKRTF
ncbi:MAG: hypothetical protein Q4E41_00095 [Bacteroidales bacterium]|nr:hypothetical protein [Bacteroidales bacterium]